MNLWRKLRAAWRSERLNAEMSEELRTHLELRAQKNRMHGTSSEEAELAARRAFGGVDQIKERCRDERVGGWIWLEQLVQDVRYALRSFARSPGFTAVVLVSLALGIGANTAIFSLLDAVLWRSLPVHAPEQLVLLERPPLSDSPVTRKFCGISYPLMEAIERREPLLAGATTFAHGGAIARIAGEARVVSVLSVAEDFYSLLGVRAASGRLIQPGDVRAGNVVVLSHGYWQRHFGGRPVIGDTLGLNHQPHTIVGVTPREFFGLNPGDNFDVSVPFREAELQAAASARGPTDLRVQPLFWVVGRLKPDVNAERAAESMTNLLRQMVREDASGEVDAAELARHRIGVSPASHGLGALRARFSRPLRVLMGLVAIVLVVTCANVANLLLARATAREREFAIRASLGAGRSRLWRQLLAESVLLALGGAVLAIFVAHWTSAALIQFAGIGQDAFVGSAALEPRTLGFTLAVAVTVGVLFGLAPAWRGAESGRTALHGRAKAGGSRVSRLTRALVVGQAALSLVLVTGAGLLGRSLDNLLRLETGIRRDRTLAVAADARAAGLAGAAAADFYQQLLTRVAGLPGVSGTTLQRNLPLSGSRSWRPFAPPGYAPPGGGDIATPTEEVGPNYFRVVGLDLVAGRDFRPSDDRNAPPVVVINEAAAREFFPGENALGRRIGRRHENRTEYEIVGIARDARQVSLREAPGPIVYTATLQDPGIRDNTLLLRTAHDPVALVPQIRQLIREVNPAVPIVRVTTLDEVVERALLQERLTARLASAFGLLGLVLAGVGLGGALLFAVTRRTAEIGIRMALGATRRGVVALVLRESLGLVALGIALGAPCAIAAGRAARGMLFGLGPDDPLTLCGAAAILGFVALLAAVWPARRAARIDPIIALRSE